MNLVNLVNFFRNSSIHVYTSSSKVTPICNFSISNAIRKLGQFLQLINFSLIDLRCYNVLTNVKNYEIFLSDPSLTVFHKIKSILSPAVKLSYIESGKEFCLVIDASFNDVGVLLQQKLISFFFRKLTPTETRSSTFGFEIKAVYSAV